MGWVRPRQAKEEGAGRLGESGGSAQQAGSRLAAAGGAGSGGGAHSKARGAGAPTAPPAGRPAAPASSSSLRRTHMIMLPMHSMHSRWVLDEEAAGSSNPRSTRRIAALSSAGGSARQLGSSCPKYMPAPLAASCASNARWRWADACEGARARRAQCVAVSPGPALRAVTLQGEGAPGRMCKEECADAAHAAAKPNLLGRGAVHVGAVLVQIQAAGR